MDKYYTSINRKLNLFIVMFFFKCILFTHYIYVDVHNLGEYGVDKFEETASLEKEYETKALLDEEYKKRELNNTDNGRQGFYRLEGGIDNIIIIIDV